MMNHRALRAKLAELNLAKRFTVAQLAEALARQRGRPLRLCPEPLPVSGPSGVLAVTPAIDVIAYQLLTSKLHQDHIICHEFGHLLAEHQLPVVTGREAIYLIAPNLNPSLVQRIVGRSCSSHDQESEAEHIADLLMSYHVISGHHQEWVMTTEAEIRSLAATLGTGD
ncbi:hypothetical protein [Mycobacterium attenuatum]|uniref:hypothetical protein n=1 Tax=Mycobacterium attenuatum TaxID=2341086 RepID=UPI000F16209D|nr:hypothetical protein [Mycobacterium attenuatum]VBA62302.1 hypothetical protein LAUMK41_05693 [Mycobacterium attenuatum]